MFYRRAGKLEECNTWDVDGAITVVDEPHYQLYADSYNENSHVFPSVYAHMNDKNLSTIRSVFTAVNNSNSELNHTALKTDFEYSAFVASNQYIRAKMRISVIFLIMFKNSILCIFCYRFFFREATNQSKKIKKEQEIFILWMKIPIH